MQSTSMDLSNWCSSNRMFVKFQESDTHILNLKIDFFHTISYLWIIKHLTTENHIKVWTKTQCFVYSQFQAFKWCSCHGHGKGSFHYSKIQVNVKNSQIFSLLLLRLNSRFSPQAFSRSSISSLNFQTTVSVLKLFHPAQFSPSSNVPCHVGTLRHI